MRFVTRRLQRAALCAATATIASVGAFAVPGVASAAAPHHHGFGAPYGSPTIGQVYLDANTTGVSSVAAFDRHARRRPRF
jgi:hypothetical protein